MHFQLIFLVSSALVSLASAGSVKAKHLKPPYCPPKPVSQQQRRLIFEEFVRKLYLKGNGTIALLDHMPEDYIQHTPSVVSGRDAAIKAVSVLTPENANVTIRHYGMDGDLAWVFSRMEFTGQAEPVAIADFLRFDGSCIQEHWDVVQERPANRANPLDMW